MALSSLRRSEWALIGYFVYVAVLAHILPVRHSIPPLIIWVNAAVIGGYVLVAYADSLRRRGLLRVMRDWFPAPLLMLAYREMGWLAPSSHDGALEREWIVWDRYLLNDLGLKALIEAAGPLLPSVLEISYTLVYAMPFVGLAALYAYGRAERADRLMFPLCLSVLLSYALFPYFPSEPPRTVFPGEDFPSYSTVFRQFNWEMLGSYGIHTSVFPSAHVSGAFAAALGIGRYLPERKWPGRAMLVLAILIASATVYGRYHYLADAAAGLAIALAVHGVTCFRWRRA